MGFGLLPFLFGCQETFKGDTVAVSAQVMLDNIEAAINARLTGGAVQSYSIGGRNLQYISLSELRQMRDQLKREVASQTPNGARTYAKFTDPV